MCDPEKPETPRENGCKSDSIRPQSSPSRSAVQQAIIGIIKEIIGIIQGLIRNTQDILIILRKTNPGSFGFRDFLYFINLTSVCKGSTRQQRATRSKCVSSALLNRT